MDHAVEKGLRLAKRWVKEVRFKDLLRGMAVITAVALVLIFVLRVIEKNLGVSLL